MCQYSSLIGSPWVVLVTAATRAAVQAIILFKLVIASYILDPPQDLDLANNVIKVGRYSRNKGSRAFGGAVHSRGFLRNAEQDKR